MGKRVVPIFEKSDVWCRLYGAGAGRGADQGEGACINAGVGPARTLPLPLRICFCFGGSDMAGDGQRPLLCLVFHIIAL